MKTIQERAMIAIPRDDDWGEGHPNTGIIDAAEPFRQKYIQGATEQKEIDEVRMRKLEEALKAYRAFCYNIINRIYIDNEKAAVEQLEYINTDFFNEEGFELLEDTK